MNIATRSKRAVVAASLLTLAAGSVAFAEAPASSDDVATELKALKTRVAELEQKESSNWMTEERTNQIRAIVQDALADARTRTQFADGPSVGYKDGFYIQTADQNFKLVVGGYAQVRYEYAYTNVNHNETTLHGSTLKTHDPGNSSGIDIRRARVSFSGNAFSPDVTFKLEGDFYGGGGPLTGTSTSGGVASASFFQVSDAFIGYRFNDNFKIKAGSYKVPFAKAELTSDPTGTFAERAEVLAPFDPVRALGVSLYGDVIKDQLGYEVSINDGGNSNTLRSDDTISNTGTGNTPNLDNRFAYYGRVQFAGSGKIADFVDETDLRTDNRQFIWLLGGAAGYESQSAVTRGFPSPQTTTTINGLTTGGNFANYTLNGNAYRGTIDWSGKWQGLSMLAAGYIQEVNAERGAGVSLPAPGNSFFEHGYYAQVGYFVIPRKLELVGRGGVLLTEGASRHAEYYSAGANYYVYGHNLKIQSDMTYTPAAAYTSATGSALANTQDLIFRVQLQLKF